MHSRLGNGINRLMHGRKPYFLRHGNVIKAHKPCFLDPASNFGKCPCEFGSCNIIAGDNSVWPLSLQKLGYRTTIAWIGKKNIMLQRPLSSALEHSRCDTAHPVGYRRGRIDAMKKCNSLGAGRDQMSSCGKSCRDIIYSNNIVF